MRARSTASSGSLTIISGLIVALVAGLVLVFSVRYRRGSRAERGELPEILKREIEIGWTAATLFLFLFIFWWAASGQLSALNAPRNALEIHVVAKQWMWRVAASERGARDRRASRPGRNARASGNDLRGRHPRPLSADAAPQAGHPAGPLHLSAGSQRPRPAPTISPAPNICGTDHARMAGKLVIVSPQDYARWTAAQPEGDDLAHQGEALFRSLGCSGCHAPASSVHAPDLDGVYGSEVQLSDGRIVTADEAYLRNSILLPRQGHRRGLRADHAELPKRRERRAARAAHRLPEIAVRICRTSWSAAMTDVVFPSRRPGAQPDELSR